MLYQLTSVLQGGLESTVSSLVSVVEALLKSAEPSSFSNSTGGSSTNLKIQVFEFLALFFKTHHLRTIQPHLSQFVSLVTSGIADTSPKIGAQSFVAASELVKVARPLSALTSPATATPSTAQIRSIFDSTINSLGRSDVDQEVRERGILCLGELIVHAGGEFGQDLHRALQILKERLRNENTRLVTLMTLSKIADSTSSRHMQYGLFMQEIANEVVTFLRRNNKPVQAASFVCLEAVLRRSGDTLSIDTCQLIVKGLQPSLSNPDIHLTRSLSSLSTILDTHPDTVSTVTSEILPSVYGLVVSPTVTVTGPSLEALLRFISMYVKSGGDALSVVSRLSNLAATSNSSVQIPMMASRCIGAIHQVIAESDSKTAGKIVKDTATIIKVCIIVSAHTGSFSFTVPEEAVKCSMPRSAHNG